jgi:hypothetical protein
MMKYFTRGSIFAALPAGVLFAFFFTHRSFIINLRPLLGMTGYEGKEIGGHTA